MSITFSRYINEVVSSLTFILGISNDPTNFWELFTPTNNLILGVCILLRVWDQVMGIFYPSNAMLRWVDELKTPIAWSD
jgi:hypothetical protein